MYKSTVAQAKTVDSVLLQIIEVLKVQYQNSVITLEDLIKIQNLATDRKELKKALKWL